LHSKRLGDTRQPLRFSAAKTNTKRVKLVTADGKRLIWAGEAGDRSLLFGALRRGGQRKIAERLVKQMRETLFSGRE
jgi:hypothetical protein